MTYLKTLLCLSLSIIAMAAHADTSIPKTFRGVSLMLEVQGSA